MKNSEKYTTTAERVTAHREWCDSHHESCDGVCGCCGIKWLDLEAEEKPMNCPFCGEVCACEGGYVECLNNNCCYSSGNRNRSDAAAIAAHNRVCKAVKSYKEG